MPLTKVQILLDLQGVKASANSHTAGAGVLHIESIFPHLDANTYKVTLHTGIVTAGNETITWSYGTLVIEIESGVSTVAQVLAAVVAGTPWGILTVGTAGILTSVAQTAMSALPAFITGVNGYVGIGTPINPGDEGSVNGVTKYLVNVNEIGLSQSSKKPTGYRKNITFYVYHEGQSDENAWYELDEPQNQSNRDVTAYDSSYFSYTKIYASEQLRQRTLGALISMADYFIIQETPVQDYHWAQQFIKDPLYFMDAFMAEVSANADVRASGNSTTDALLYYCLDTLRPKIATAFGIS